jgi:hypothetical protein
MYDRWLVVFNQQGRWFWAGAALLIAVQSSSDHRQSVDWQFWQCWHWLFPITAFPRQPLSSTTSSGHSGQLCIQHTIMSHPSRSCACLRKLRLSCSNSIFSRRMRPGATSRRASQSGKPVWISVTMNPSFIATAPNKRSTPFSLVGAFNIGAGDSTEPYTGRSSLIGLGRVPGAGIWCLWLPALTPSGRESPPARPAISPSTRACSHIPPAPPAPSSMT